MRIIGFNLTKFSASKEPVQKPNLSIKTDLKFIDIKKDSIPLIKEEDILQYHFEFTLTYESKENVQNNQKQKNALIKPYAQLIIQGIIIAATNKADSDKVLQAWKKKEVLKEVRYPLYNLIFSKCSVKAMQWEEELNLPLHVPFPRISEQQNTQTQHNQNNNQKQSNNPKQSQNNQKQNNNQKPQNSKNPSYAN